MSCSQLRRSHQEYITKTKTVTYARERMLDYLSSRTAPLIGAPLGTNNRSFALNGALISGIGTDGWKTGIKIFVFVMQSWWNRRNCEHDVISPIVMPVITKTKTVNDIRMRTYVRLFVLSIVPIWPLPSLATCSLQAHTFRHYFGLLYTEATSHDMSSVWPLNTPPPPITSVT